MISVICEMKDQSLYTCILYVGLSLLNVALENITLTQTRHKNLWSPLGRRGDIFIVPHQGCHAALQFYFGGGGDFVFVCLFVCFVGLIRRNVLYKFIGLFREIRGTEALFEAPILSRVAFFHCRKNYFI